MKTHPVSLSTTSADNSLIKEGALLFFTAIRTAADYIAEMPDAVSQAASDIRAAWEESSRPNA